MKTFLCELERDGKVSKAIVRANDVEEATNNLSLNWQVISIKEHQNPYDGPDMVSTGQRVRIWTTR